jgi:hypothetical protein
LRALEHGFATGADFLIHLEDDIVPARDFLHYMEWAADEHLHHQLRRGRSEIYPALSRVQNIGACGGVHVPSPAWHRAHHHVPFWAGNTTLASGTFGPPARESLPQT